MTTFSRMNSIAAYLTAYCIAIILLPASSDLVALAPGRGPYPDEPVYRSDTIFVISTRNNKDRRSRVNRSRILKTIGKFEGFNEPTCLKNNRQFFRITEPAFEALEKQLKQQRVTYIKHIKYKTPFKCFLKDFSQQITREFNSPQRLKSSYKDNMLNEILLGQTARNYSEFIEYHSLGTTTMGRQIPALLLTDFSIPDTEKVSILFMAGIHANEPNATEHVFDILHQFISDTDRYRDFLKQFRIWLVPMLNPDGGYLFWHKAAGMGRKNGFLHPEHKPHTLNRGVDLNRNFPFKWGLSEKSSSSKPSSVFFRGNSAASEPETRAIIKLALKEAFLLTFTWHSAGTAILIPYTVEELKNPEPHFAAGFAERLAAGVNSLRPDRDFVAKKNLYPVDGTDQDYFFNRIGSQSFIIESTHRAPEYSLGKKVVKELRVIWQRALLEYDLAPRISLRTINFAGEPVQASFDIHEIRFFENERLINSKLTGNFDYLVETSGKFTVTIHAKGYKSRTIQYQAIPGSARIELEMAFNE